MRSSIITFGLVGAIGIIIGLLLHPPGATSTNKIAQQASATDSLPGQSNAEGNNQAATLSARLQQEIVARKSLETKVSLLGKQVEKLSGKKIFTELEDNDPSESPHTSASDNPDSDTPGSENPGSDNAGADKTWFNKQALLDAGIEESEAEQLKTTFEELEMKKLYLRYRAIREGWAGGNRYREELKKLDDQVDNLEEQLGEKGFSAYLYATGRSNRVEVQSVLTGSPASAAGIQTGDQILSYDNQRVYNWGNLREATSRGTLDEIVTVEVMRDGKQMQFYLPRGPMGIRMTSVSIAP